MSRTEISRGGAWQWNARFHKEICGVLAGDIGKADGTTHVLLISPVSIIQLRTPVSSVGKLQVCPTVRTSYSTSTNHLRGAPARTGGNGHIYLSSNDLIKCRIEVI